MNDLTREEKREWFEEDFFTELDSWFSADIACCDMCYDEFIAIWPHADEAEDAKLQRAGHPLDLIYSGSRLADMYTEEEFETFIQDVSCPRCRNILGANIWPYEFPFYVDPEFEVAISEISIIAKNTPFLVLRHEFARKIYDKLAELASNLQKIQFSTPLFRARSGNLRKQISIFDAPPADVVVEGRYNHAGSPVLYLASDAKTCVEEMRRISCTIAEIELIEPISVLDLINPEDSHTDYFDELSALTYSALLSAKQPKEDSWHKPEYVFSRFIADCAKELGIQAIKYPSTKIVTSDNFNLVIIDSSIHLTTHAKINCVSYYETQE